MKKACIILAEGFEEIEALTVVDCLRRADIYVNVTSLDEDLLVNGAHDIKVKAESTFSSIDLSDFDILVLPGGGLGTSNLSASELVCESLDYMSKNDKYIAAICAAPSVLGKNGLLEGKTACCYPGFEGCLNGANVSYNGVEKSGNIITGRAMGVSIDFSLAIIETLIGKEAADKVADSIIYCRK